MTPGGEVVQAERTLREIEQGRRPADHPTIRGAIYTVLAELDRLRKVEATAHYWSGLREATAEERNVARCILHGHSATAVDRPAVKR